MNKLLSFSKREGLEIIFSNSFNWFFKTLISWGICSNSNFSLKVSLFFSIFLVWLLTAISFFSAIFELSEIICSFWDKKSWYPPLKTTTSPSPLKYKILFTNLSKKSRLWDTTINVPLYCDRIDSTRSRVSVSKSFVGSSKINPLLGFDTVSYTHLTLPTNREV